jgi:hypothetical protein
MTAPLVGALLVVGVLLVALVMLRLVYAPTPQVHYQIPSMQRWGPDGGSVGAEVGTQWRAMFVNVKCAEQAG